MKKEGEVKEKEAGGVIGGEGGVGRRGGIVGWRGSEGGRQGQTGRKCVHDMAGGACNVFLTVPRPGGPPYCYTVHRNMTTYHYTY